MQVCFFNIVNMASVVLILLIAIFHCFTACFKFVFVSDTSSSNLYKILIGAIEFEKIA